MKGRCRATSWVVDLIDCDDDTVLVKVKRLGDGNVCHTGERTCFFRTLRNTKDSVLCAESAVKR
jgi:phosphoribosyl-AMP cyclohydrolase